MEVKELTQAGDFLAGLSEPEKNDFEEAVAEDIFFLEEDLQEKVISLLNDIAPGLGTDISRRNDFTT